MVHFVPGMPTPRALQLYDKVIFHKESLYTSLEGVIHSPPPPEPPSQSVHGGERREINSGAEGIVWEKKKKKEEVLPIQNITSLNNQSIRTAPHTTLICIGTPLNFK